jgi:hypothetical protein
MGFYKKQGSDVLTLDPALMVHRGNQPVRLPSLDAARGIEDTGARIESLFLGQDKVGAFLRRTSARRCCIPRA